jgi:hypothetical protein
MTIVSIPNPLRLPKRVRFTIFIEVILIGGVKA